MVNTRRRKGYKDTFEPVHVMYAKVKPEIEFDVEVNKDELVEWCSNSMVEECYYGELYLDGLKIYLRKVMFNDHEHAALFRLTFVI